MTDISTHVLDTALGQPAGAVGVVLSCLAVDGSWTSLGTASTDDDGRVRGLEAWSGAEAGVYRLVFASGDYVRRQGSEPFFEEVTVTFNVDTESHLHVPVLLSPYGYSVYRGS